MKTLIDLITEQVTNAFTGQGYDAKYGKVTLSNRPDLCEYQCNGAMAAAKEYKCAPFIISDKIAQALAEKELFESVESVKPGFINMKVSPAYLAKYVSDMKADEGRFGCDKAAHPKTIIVDYGGANVAKPLHVGHLRSAAIEQHITPHMFRHTFATSLLEADVDIRYIQEMLGHSSIHITEIYTHVAMSKQRAILTTRHPRNTFHL